MKKTISVKFVSIAMFLLAISNSLFSQQDNISKLKINEIMKGEDYTGYSPDQINWSSDSKKIYFRWNPSHSENDSLYQYNIEKKRIQSIYIDTVRNMPTSLWVYSGDKTRAVFARDGDIFLYDILKDKFYQITKTNRRESNPYFICDESKIAFHEDDNIYSWELATGQIVQLTDFINGFPGSKEEEAVIDKDDWLEKDQLKLFSVLREKEDKKKKKSEISSGKTNDRPLPLYMNGMDLFFSQLSPNGKFVTYILYKKESSKGTIVPDFVTKSGYTESINSRSKVGDQPAEYKMFIYNIEERKTNEVDFSKLEGINDLPAYLKDYPKNKYEKKSRIGSIDGPFWNTDGTKAFIEIRANDNKDRWLALLNIESGEAQMLDRQHNDAWIDGPGIGYFSDYIVAMGWMPDDNRIWFQSEESGYSHLYAIDIRDREKKAITKGKFEIYNPTISEDHRYWYFSSNENHPGVVHFYRMPLEGGKPEQLTNMPGNNEVYMSPDESKLAIRHSFTNKPWELYVMDNPAVTVKIEDAFQITHSTSEQFKSYPWRAPEIITFKAGDGKEVYARLYKPDENVKNKAAVIFVHGAGYLQNAHQWWSSYFREYMFNNLLADNGFIVLDIDYRGSAGYGSEWRTGIYRHMGGKDLSDCIDGAKFLIKNMGIDKERIGIYGGSYGGFLTLMAMFKASETFRAGAAIRSVTDWAHYNNGFTASILNSPITDSLAYYRSSPIYYTEGLKGHLLISHGMIDDNVHFQDVVRLSQKLIELGKENWELAVYPIERHAFVDPASWIDEYLRIFKFFKNNLLQK